MAASARLYTSARRVLRVGGVPEHFNTPWHTAAKAGLFAAQGIDLHWTDFPGGTGAMAAALRQGELDVAILLTEGIVADIHKGNPARLIGTYVASPLTWGIHVSASSPLVDADALYSQPAGDGLASPRFAVSRMTSGSHLMAFVDARRRAGDAVAASLRFEIVGNLEGARTCLRDGGADAFLWEKFTTKPLVDSGEWRRIGECVTEWPCFSAAATPAAIAHAAPELRTMLSIVASEAERLRASPDAAEVIGQKNHVPRHLTTGGHARPYTHHPAGRPHPRQVIGQMYGLQPVDVSEWLKTVEWASSPAISSSMLRHVRARRRRQGGAALEREAGRERVDFASRRTSHQLFTGGGGMGGL